ncbi:MAG: ABC transporter ATP-binding protein [Clostridia bacterium]|nr:ABC transporter ATP-binding protein [Clostridia bacterium]
MRNESVFIDYFLHMEYSKLEDSEYKDLGMKVMDAVNAVTFVDGTVTPFFTALLKLAGYSYIITQLHPLIIALILLIIFLNSKITKKLQKIGYDFKPVATNLSRKTSYLFRSMIRFDFGKEIRINEASEWLKEKYKAETDNYITEVNKKYNKEFKIKLLTCVINAVQTIVMYGYSAYRAVTGAISIGDFNVYLGAITNFTGSFNDFISSFVWLKTLSDYVDDYKKYKELVSSSLDEANCVDFELDEEGKYTIEFKNVSFKYPNTEKYVLKDVSIKIEPGTRLSIVGYNGAGKSTFIKLLCRLYKPTSGTILLNGVDISKIDFEKYRDVLAVVFQDYQLFSFSVKENIVLDLEFDETRVKEAVEKSGLNEKIEELERGLDTSIGREFDENGIEFSGGEGQKLACARAFYRDSPVVILDEPTASLDPLAESALYERFNNIIGDKTAIYISHRLASVKFCDIIAVFADGEIVEYGTHSDLMKKDGVYAEMFSKQAQYYVEKEAE